MHRARGRLNDSRIAAERAVELAATTDLVLEHAAALFAAARALPGDDDASGCVADAHRLLHAKEVTHSLGVAASPLGDVRPDRPLSNRAVERARTHSASARPPDDSDDPLRELADGRASVVAVRGDDLWLSYHGRGGESEFVVGIDDPDGRPRLVRFPGDDVEAARHELDRRHLATCGLDEDHWVARCWNLAYSLDFEALRSVFHPDLEYVDRRRLLERESDASGLAAIIDVVVPGTTAAIPRIHRMSSTGAVFERVESAEDDPGASHAVLRLEFADDLIRRLTVHDLDDLELALEDHDGAAGAAGVAGRARRLPSRRHPAPTP